MINVESKLQL
jgi:hypothetical protein